MYVCTYVYIYIYLYMHTYIIRVRLLEGINRNLYTSGPRRKEQ